MQTSEKELEIARKYMSNEYTEVQFNYLLVQNKIDRIRMESIIENLSYQEPMAIVAKLMIAYIMTHFAFCVAYSLMINAG
jgi:hypothetical protein